MEPLFDNGTPVDATIWIVGFVWNFLGHETPAGIEKF